MEHLFRLLGTWRHARDSWLLFGPYLSRSLVETNPSPGVWAASCLILFGIGPEGEGQERSGSEDREEGLGWGNFAWSWRGWLTCLERHLSLDDLLKRDQELSRKITDPAFLLPLGSTSVAQVFPAQCTGLDSGTSGWDSYCYLPQQHLPGGGGWGQRLGDILGYSDGSARVSLTSHSLYCYSPLPGLQTTSPLNVTVPIFPSCKVAFSSKLPSLPALRAAKRPPLPALLFYRRENRDS